MSNVKILYHDIETSPHLAYVWKLFKENIPLERLINHGDILSYAWAFNDEEVKCVTRNVGDEKFFNTIWNTLNDADIVIGHNSNKFDLPIVNGCFLERNINPPSPYRKVDTYVEAKKYFRLASNKLEYLARLLGVNGKVKHTGFELWDRCIKGEKAAFKEMAEYNMQDVRVVRDVYYKMRPWMQNHPNMNLFREGEEDVCPKCGSHKLHYRGYAATAVGVYHRFQCQGCGGWGRSTVKQNGKVGVRNVQ